MNSGTTQSQFFQLVKSQLPPHKALVDEVAGLLGISNDSAYRRIRGDKPLDIDELARLAAHFRLSLDQLLQLPNDALLFTGKPQAAGPNTLEGWLANMLAQLQLMNSFGHRHLYYLLKDIPPFYHFQIPELAEFKLFFWTKSILHDDSLKGVRFRFGDPRYQNCRPICQRIVQLYSQLPTTEIWNGEPEQYPAPDRLLPRVGGLRHAFGCAAALPKGRRAHRRPRIPGRGGGKVHPAAARPQRPTLPAVRERVDSGR